MLATSDIESIRPETFSHARPDSFNDETLWNSFKKGNELALSMLYKKHVQALYNYGRHTTKDHDLVLDSIQELFSRLWIKRETLASVNSVKLYLFKSFRRTLLRHIIAKRKLFVPLTDQLVAFEFIPSFEYAMIEGEYKAEQLKRLKACIQSLTKTQREVVFLKFFNELSYVEISEVMEMRVESVYNLVSKTIELLRKKLLSTNLIISMVSLILPIL
jgi:RNA polymerase sigma factor (sigma-70 family)